MSDDCVLNQKDYLEKNLYYEGKDWKLKIIISINSLILNLSQINDYENILNLNI